jgi:hypothetical protein
MLISFFFFINFFNFHASCECGAVWCGVCVCTTASRKKYEKVYNKKKSLTQQKFLIYAPVLALLSFLISIAEYNIKKGKWLQMHTGRGAKKTFIRMKRKFKIEEGVELNRTTF